MEPLTLPIVLFCVGAVLVAMELFLPGGVLGALGALAIIGGVVACFFYSTTSGVIAMTSVAVLGPLVGWLWVANAHRLPGARSLFLAGTADPNPAIAPPPLRPGQTGVAASELRPGGICDFDGDRVDCQSEAGIIPAGTTVRVVAFEDGNAIVRPV